MRRNWAKSLELVLRAEGGNVDDPYDPGGRTSRGVTQRVYNAYRERLRKSQRDVWAATAEEIADIYQESYWDPWCDMLPSGVDYLFFDFSVNAGPYRAIRCLQSALDVRADGVIGPVTRMALAKAQFQGLVISFSTQRREFYFSLHMSRFIHGWLNRANAAEHAALAMIASESENA